MNKRLTKTDYFFTFLLLFALIAILAAFFYGVKVGRDKTTDKYERILVQYEMQNEGLTAYHQQYLVSFYHTIYLPYADFQHKWFAHMETIDIESGSAKPENLLQELERMARDKFRETEGMSMPASSPLLQESHDNYLKSLKLFAEALDRFRPGSRTGAALIAEIEEDAYFQEAKNFALTAQQQYFAAIVAWQAAVDADFTGQAPDPAADLALTEWAKLELNEKNAYIAGIMERMGYYAPYLPQDLTIRIDEMILAGQAEGMGIETIGPIADMLVATDAVRAGDFTKKRDKFYKGELLPQLPFY